MSYKVGDIVKSKKTGLICCIVEINDKYVTVEWVLEEMMIRSVMPIENFKFLSDKEQCEFISTQLKKELNDKS